MRAIVEATRRVLANVGPDALTPAAVAKVAGVSNGTLYTYFPTKVSLLQAVEEGTWTDFVDRVIADLERHIDIPLEDAAYKLAFMAVDMLAKQGRLHGFTPLGVEGVLQSRAVIVERIVEAIAAALERAEGRVRVKPKDITLALHLILRVAASMAWRGATDFPERIDSGELQDEVATMIARYLVGEPSDAVRAASKAAV